MVIKVAFYTRVSTANKHQEYQQQIDALHRELEIWKARGEQLEHYKTFVDETSAYDAEKFSKRAGFLDMMEEARQHNFDWLVVWSQDRFSRLNTFETYHHLNRLINEYKIRYRTIQMDLDSNNPVTFHAFLGLIQENAKAYSEKLGANIRRGIKAKRKNKDGTWKALWGVAILQQRLKNNGTYRKIIDLRKIKKSYREISKEVYYYDHNGNKKFVSAGLIRSVIKYYAHQTINRNLEENNNVTQQLVKVDLDEYNLVREITKSNFDERS